MAPEFLQQLQAYLQARPNVPFQTWLANRNAPATAAPSGITALPSGPAATPAPGMSMPPPGYRYGVDPEWNYGFKSMVKYEKPADDKAKKKYTGGTVSTGNAKADAAVIAGNQSVINNLKASAMYAAQDNAKNGTPIPAGLKSFLPSSGGDVRRTEDRAAVTATPGKYTGFWDRINGGGPGAGYTSPVDWINGGGMGGSYAKPGTNIRGVGAIVNDLQKGGISALARDFVNGGGLGASGEKFRGGKWAVLGNLLGLNPAGEEKSVFNRIPEASPELEAQWAANQRYGWKPDKEKGKFSINNLFGTGGTKGTEGTYKKAAGGIMDIPDPVAEQAPAQPPMGNEKELISSTIAAIKGQVEDPRPILGAFLAKYGEEALRNLVDKVESGDVDQTAARSGGMLKGPGDGMDDRIPAKVENGHDVLLANNEYIVPADVVSALGNGSSDAGAEHMDKMLERVRTAAHGKATQQKKVSADKVLPA